MIDRAAKWVTLSPQAREALAIPDDAPAEMTPADVIRWVLQAPVDLLWNGGIGTYVKASNEGHTEVGDRANDPVRINGNQVRARVVGEGGNLGFTQRGRIEYALTGGRINSDFIDNSAGVDTSDREVNLKILLGLAIERGELTTDERNALLEACTDDVVRRVLYDNYLQAQILSQEVAVAAERNEACEDLMLQLEAEGELDRSVEFLPTSDEMAERRGRGEGLTRPELALLVAYSKRSIKRDLLDADLPDSEYLEQDLARYFPEKIVDRFRGRLAEHPLRRELIATIVSNDVVNSQGVTFVSRLVAETGATPAEVVRAFRIARDVVGAVARWDAVESLDGKIDPALQNELMTGVDRLVESTARWYLVRAPGLRLGEAVDQARAAFQELSSVIEQIGPEAWREQREREAARLTTEGVPDELARRPRSRTSWCTGRTSSRCRGPRVGRSSRSRGASSCWASGSRSTGSSSASRSSRRRRAGSDGRCTRWRTTCTRSVARSSRPCWSMPAAGRSTRRSMRSSRIGALPTGGCSGSCDRSRWRA